MLRQPSERTWIGTAALALAAFCLSVLCLFGCPTGQPVEGSQAENGTQSVNGASCFLRVSPLEKDLREIHDQGLEYILSEFHLQFLGVTDTVGFKPDGESKRLAYREYGETDEQGRRIAEVTIWEDHPGFMFSFEKQWYCAARGLDHKAFEEQFGELMELYHGQVPIHGTGEDIGRPDETHQCLQIGILSIFREICLKNDEPGEPTAEKGTVRVTAIPRQE